MMTDWEDSWTEQQPPGSIRDDRLARRPDWPGRVANLRDIKPGVTVEIHQLDEDSQEVRLDRVVVDEGPYILKDRLYANFRPVEGEKANRASLADLGVVSYPDGKWTPYYYVTVVSPA